MENIEQLIEAWFQKNFHGTKVSENTEIYNIVHAAKEDLKQQLTAIIGE